MYAPFGFESMSSSHHCHPENRRSSFDAMGLMRTKGLVVPFRSRHPAVVTTSIGSLLPEVRKDPKVPVHSIQIFHNPSLNSPSDATQSEESHVRMALAQLPYHKLGEMAKGFPWLGRGIVDAVREHSWRQGAVIPTRGHIQLSVLICLCQSKPNLSEIWPARAPPV